MGDEFYSLQMNLTRLLALNIVTTSDARKVEELIPQIANEDNL